MSDKKLEYTDPSSSQILIDQAAPVLDKADVKFAAYIRTDHYGASLTPDQCDEAAALLHSLAAKVRDDGTLTFSFTMSPEIHARLRSQLGLRKIAGESWGLSDSFVARILTCFERGITSWNFDKVKSPG